MRGSTSELAAVWVHHRSFGSIHRAMQRGCDEMCLDAQSSQTPVLGTPPLCSLATSGVAKL